MNKEEIVYTHRVDGTTYEVVRTEDGRLETRPVTIRGLVDEAIYQDLINAGINFSGISSGYEITGDNWN